MVAPQDFGPCHFANFNGGYPEIICSAKLSPNFTCGWESDEPVTCSRCLKIMASWTKEEAAEDARQTKARAKWSIVR